MGPNDKIAVLHKILADFATTGSVDGLLEILTEDVVYRVMVSPGTPLSGGDLAAAYASAGRVPRSGS